MVKICIYLYLSRNSSHERTTRVRCRLMGHSTHLDVTGFLPALSKPLDPSTSVRTPVSQTAQRSPHSTSPPGKSMRTCASEQWIDCPVSLTLNSAA